MLAGTRGKRNVAGAMGGEGCCWVQGAEGYCQVRGGKGMLLGPWGKRDAGRDEGQRGAGRDKGQEECCWGCGGRGMLLGLWGQRDAARAHRSPDAFCRLGSARAASIWNVCGLLRDITSAHRKYLFWKEKDHNLCCRDEPAVCAACARACYLSDNLFALSSNQQNISNDKRDKAGWQQMRPIFADAPVLTGVGGV